jgi:hypothetical protein
LKFGAEHIRFTIHSTSLAWIGRRLLSPQAKAE